MAVRAGLRHFAGVAVVAIASGVFAAWNAAAAEPPPVAVGDSYWVAQDQQLNVAAPGVLGNDTDPEGLPLTASVVSPPPGTFSLNADGSFSWTPPAGFTGSTSFTYKANNGVFDSAPTTVSLLVGTLYNDLIAWYKFDDASGSTVRDATNLGHDATITGATAWTTGIHAGALNFFGNARADAAHKADLHPASWTLATWLRRGAIDTQHGLIEKYEGHAGYALRVLPDNRASVVLVSGTFPAAASTTTILPGAWFHVAGTFNDATDELKIYVNGQLEGTATTTLTSLSSSLPLRLGARGDDANCRLNGLLDDARIYSRALSAAEVNALAQIPPTAPQAAPDTYSIATGTSLNVAAPGVLANDSDINGGTLSAAKLSDPANGTLTFNSDGSFTYVPNAGYSGSDSFTYSASDGALSSAAATVTIVVNAAPTVASVTPSSGYSLTLSNVALSGTGFRSPPANAAVFNGHTYAFVNSSVQFATAETACEAIGGHLVTCTTAAENAFVRSLLGSNMAWMGLTDAAAEGNWAWITGEPFNYSNWNGSEPNGGTGENYGHIYSSGIWNDTAAATSMPYVCEFDHVISPPVVKFTRAGQPDITATNVRVTDAQNLLFDIDLTSALPGAWTVRVTNFDGSVGELSGAFTVNVGPQLSTVSPSSAERGTTANLHLTGSNIPVWSGTIGQHPFVTCDGVDDKFSIIHADGFNSANITIEAWVKDGFLFQKRNSIHGAGNQFYFGAKNGVATFKITSSSITYTLSSNATIGSTWTHIAASYDGATQRIYINGVLDASNAINVPIQVSFGHPSLYYDEIDGIYFQGSMREFRFWKATRSAAEIAANMNVDLSAGHADLFARYSGVGSGSNMSDTTGNSNTATGIGSPVFQSGSAGAPVFLRMKKGTSIVDASGPFTSTATEIDASFVLPPALPTGVYDLQLLNGGIVVFTLSSAFTVTVPPALDVTLPEPEPLTYSGKEGVPQLLNKTLSIKNTGAGTLSWTVADDAAWLSVGPSNGTTTTETDALTAQVDTAGLTAAGSPYTATITISAPGATGAPRAIPVVLNIAANHAPTTLSAPQVLPNPALIGQSVSFFVLGGDSDGDTLTYAWNFGDGSSATANSASHAYSAAGTYPALAIISDGRGGSVSVNVSVVVNAPSTGGGGGGTPPAGGGGANPPAPPPPPDADGDSLPNSSDPDDDNDGISDIDEAALGTDPLNPASPTLRRLNASRLSGAVNFSKSGRDNATVSGTIEGLPDGFDIEGAIVMVSVGGAAAEFTLGSNGRARSSMGTFTLKKQSSSFTASLRNGSWADEWADEGVDPASDATNAAISMTVILRINGMFYATQVSATYSGKAGKGGRFK